MRSVDGGMFVVVDGPSGVGKTTLVAQLSDRLLSNGIDATATKEPTSSELGSFIRAKTHEYHGLSLACLVAADRYNHLAQVIRPTLERGHVVICDRYVPTTLVLQRLDGVDVQFLKSLNQFAPVPDLTVILIGKPEQSAKQAKDRGLYSRFHDGGAERRAQEERLYNEVAEDLKSKGAPVLLQEMNGDLDDSTESVFKAIMDKLQGQSVD